MVDRASSPKTPSQLARAARFLLTLLGVGYPLALLGLVLLLRLVGDDWWVTSVALYLPPIGFALPLPFVVLVLLLARRFRLLMLQLVSLWLLLFPLMGLELSWRSYPSQNEPHFRILTYNVDSVNAGPGPLVDEILSHSPDVVVMQELPSWRAEAVKALLAPTFPHIQSEDQFMVASKYPFVPRPAPALIPFFGQLRHPRFRSFELESPLGKVVVYNLHTVSPRSAFQQLRGRGLRREISSGHIFSGGASRPLRELSALRNLQVEALSKLAHAEAAPVLIAGDSNLPTLSGVRAKHLGGFHDGFAEAGLGFGFSYPTKWPWMRIDLLLSNDRLRFTRVEVGPGRASDHRCVFGDVVAAK